MKARSVREIIRSILSETVTNDAVYLKKYMNMSDDEKSSDLAYTYSYKLSDFLEDAQFSGKLEQDVADKYLEIDEYEAVETMQDEDPQLFNDFGKYLMGLLNQGKIGWDSETPAWSFYTDVNYIRNQWLVHFTDRDSAINIVRNGFKRGVEDISKLALTTRLGSSHFGEDGYNFAFLHSDVKKYETSKYGDTAVIFMASGVIGYHHADQEDQVIFKGNTAKHINLMYRDRNSDEWTINDKNGRKLYSNERKNKVVDWFVNNYNNFKKVLK